jgi:MtN3 and saliva related transmembrane protein
MSDLFDFDGFVAVMGIVAAVLVTSSLVPQIKKSLTTKSMQDVSLYLVVLLLCGFFLWTVYGVLRGDWIIIGANAVNTSLNTLLLVLKLEYSKGR